MCVKLSEVCTAARALRGQDEAGQAGAPVFVVDTAAPAARALRPLLLQPLRLLHRPAALPVGLHQPLQSICLAIDSIHKYSSASYSNQNHCRNEVCGLGLKQTMDHRIVRRLR